MPAWTVMRRPAQHSVAPIAGRAASRSRCRSFLRPSSSPMGVLNSVDQSMDPPAGSSDSSQRTQEKRSPVRAIAPFGSSRRLPAETS